MIRGAPPPSENPEPPDPTQTVDATRRELAKAYAAYFAGRYQVYDLMIELEKRLIFLLPRL